ncbi:MAG: CHRD domain-containing protein [Chloroflexia bacterium]
MRNIRLLAFLLLSLFTIAGTAAAAPGGKNASNGTGDDNSLTFVTQLTGDEETPPVQTDSHGVAIFHVSRDLQSIDFKLMARDIISVTAGHIHTGTIGIAGPVVLPLVSSSACTVNGDHINCEGTATAANLTGPLAGHPLSDLVTLMQEGRAYANMHTTVHPAGEIRGQLGRHGSPATASAAEQQFLAESKGGIGLATLATGLGHQGQICANH